MTALAPGWYACGHPTLRRHVTAVHATTVAVTLEDGSHTLQNRWVWEQAVAAGSATLVRTEEPPSRTPMRRKG